LDPAGPEGRASWVGGHMCQQARGAHDATAARCVQHCSMQHGLGTVQDGWSAHIVLICARLVLGGNAWLFVCSRQCESPWGWGGGECGGVGGYPVGVVVCVCVRPPDVLLSS
jgi:hypothetical protein